MENKDLKVNDFVAYLLKTNEDMQTKIYIDNKDKEGLSNLKIQKLVYFIEANFLINFNSQLFSNDYKVWPYGPVIQELYEILKNFKRQNIFHNEFKEKGNYKKIQEKLSKEELLLIKKTFIYFNKYSPFELVSLSHIDGPWKELSTNDIITKENMINFFRKNNKVWPTV